MVVIGQNIFDPQRRIEDPKSKFPFLLLHSRVPIPSPSFLDANNEYTVMPSAFPKDKDALRGFPGTPQ